MNKLLIPFLLMLVALCACTISFAQVRPGLGLTKGPDGAQILTPVFRDTTKEEFNTQFPTDLDKSKMIRLRSFLLRKDEEATAINGSLKELIDEADYYTAKVDTNEDKVLLQVVERYQEEHPGVKTIDRSKVPAELSKVLMTFGYSFSRYDSAFNLVVIKERLEESIRRSRKRSIQIQVFKESLKNIDKDRNNVMDAMQEFYDVEKASNDFKKTMSLGFAGLILILLVGFFFFLYSRSDQSMGELFLSGNGLQFITLFAIIIATILFGVLGILEGKELAAILSGIAGFILGKGIEAKRTSPPERNSGGAPRPDATPNPQ